MKYLLILLLVFAISPSFAQWDNTSNNSTTGSLTIGSDVAGSYSFFTIRGPNSPGGIDSKREINFDFLGAGDAAIRSYRGYSWDSHIQFMTSAYTNVGGIPSVRLHIQGSGNVGIGTTDPTYKLTVADGDIKASRYDQNSGVSLGAEGSERPRIGFHVSDNNRRFKIELQDVNQASERLGFFTNAAGAWAETEVFTIGKSGKIGIGTTVPDNKLEVTDNFGTPTFGIRGHRDSKIIFEPDDGSDRFTIWSDMESSTYSDLLRFGAANSPDILVIRGDGNVGIGTTTPDTKLTVKGVIHTNEVRVDMNAPIQGPDYVFEKDYDLLPLSELETYIKQNKHLPEVPSAKEMEAEGLNLKEMNLLLLKKVEELTLHILNQQKQINNQQNQITELTHKIQ